MKLTIITDNTVHSSGLKSEWGFACLVEAEGAPKILFDTGASASVLLYNMEKLGIDPKSIGCVLVSHDHWDHTGGLDGFLELNSDVKLYLPGDLPSEPVANKVIKVKEAAEIYGGVFSTGLLQNIEQSLLVKVDKGVVVIVGCSHPGVRNTLASASDIGKPIALIGGLHGFRELDLIEDIDLVCATHCTQYKQRIKKLYPEKFVEGGAGKIIRVST